MTRCDSKEIDNLCLMANRLIRKEAKVSLMSSQISVASNEMEPSSLEEVYQLFGNKGQKWDGIHLRALGGPEKLFGTLSRVIASL